MKNAALADQPGRGPIGRAKLAPSRYDAAAAARYRRADEALVGGAEYERMATRLGVLTSGSRGGLTVLDLGCGTGRWFHCYKNVERLVGIDTSAEMLAFARDPIRPDEVGAARVELHRTDVHGLDADPGTFDLVVSIGVLGQHAPFDARTAARLDALLAEGGRAFFTIVDAASVPGGSRRRLLHAVRWLIPWFLRGSIDRRRRSFFLSRSGLEKVLRIRPSWSIEIERHVSMDPRWRGAYFECLVRKRPGSDPA